MRAIPSAMDAASVGCKRSHATDADGQGECPVCLNEFEASGPRTKVRPYICDNHAICSACDRTLYVRHDDRCPICRTGRSGASAERNGPRPFALPPAMDFPVVNGAHSYQATRIENGLADVMSWLPRRFFANGRSVVDGNNVARSPLSDWAAQYNTGGGRVFYTDPDELEEWQAEGGTGAELDRELDEGVAGYRAAAESRRLRGVPVVVSAATAAAAATADLAAISAVLAQDEGISAALDGLINVHNTTASDFARSARRAHNFQAIGRAMDAFSAVHRANRVVRQARSQSQ